MTTTAASPLSWLSIKCSAYSGTHIFNRAAANNYFHNWLIYWILSRLIVVSNKIQKVVRNTFSQTKVTFLVKQTKIQRDSVYRHLRQKKEKASKHHNWKAATIKMIKRLICSLSTNHCSSTFLENFDCTAGHAPKPRHQTCLKDHDHAWRLRGKRCIHSYWYIGKIWVSEQCWPYGWMAKKWFEKSHFDTFNTIVCFVLKRYILRSVALTAEW